MPPNPSKTSFLPRKLLVAAVGVATINYVGGTACGGKTDGSDDPRNTQYPPTSGNLPAPTATVPPTSGNLPAPPPDPPGCPTTTPIDATKLPWKPPSVLPGSCTTGDLAALIAYIDANPGAQYADWKASVASATCQACVFGTDGPTWAPLVESGSGELAILNVGGCIAIASGSEACGKSYQNWYDCRTEACADCAGDASSMAKCLAVASKGACRAAFDAVPAFCGEKGIADAETACDGTKFVFEGAVKAQCIGLFDGGGGDGG